MEGTCAGDQPFGMNSDRGSAMLVVEHNCWSCWGDTAAGNFELNLYMSLESNS